MKGAANSCARDAFPQRMIVSWFLVSTLVTVAWLRFGMNDLSEFLRTYYEAWSSQNPENVVRFFCDDAVFEDLAFEAVFTGRAEIRSFVDLTYAGVPDFRVIPSKIFGDHENAAAEWVMSGTPTGDMPGLAPNGKRFEIRAASIVRLREGLIESITDYWSLTSFRRIVGIDP